MSSRVQFEYDKELMDLSVRVDDGASKTISVRELEPMENKERKNYIVPMRKIVNGKCEEVKVIISAKTPYEAWCGAIYNFKDDGWLVFSEYDKYDQLK